MPASQRGTSTPTVVHTRTVAPAPERTVGFPPSPVTGISRPLDTAESWALYHFEVHARGCDSCANPYEVHRSGRQLCTVGHKLAQEVAVHIYREDGKIYSKATDNHKLVRVELPAGYNHVRGLLKAVERSLRHRRRQPFVSQDRTFYVSARLPERTRPVKIEQPSSPTSTQHRHQHQSHHHHHHHSHHHHHRRHSHSRPRPEIVDWPAEEKAKTATVEVSRRGSLYEADIAEQRRASARYSVEIREPNRREAQTLGYYS